MRLSLSELIPFLFLFFFIFRVACQEQQPRTTTSPVQHSFPWLSCISCVRVVYSACPFSLSVDTVKLWYSYVFINVTFDSCLFFFCCSTSSVQKHLLYFIYLFLHPSPLPPILDANTIAAHLESRQMLQIYCTKSVSKSWTLKKKKVFE